VSGPQPRRRVLVDPAGSRRPGDRPGGPRPGRGADELHQRERRLHVHRRAELQRDADVPRPLLPAARRRLPRRGLVLPGAGDRRPGARRHEHDVHRGDAGLRRRARSLLREPLERLVLHVLAASVRVRVRGDELLQPLQEGGRLLQPRRQPPLLQRRGMYGHGERARPTEGSPSPGPSGQADPESRPAPIRCRRRSMCRRGRRFRSYRRRERRGR
jgi:hypothetical protein